MNSILYLFLAWNILVFFLYGADKYKATHKKYRISEATLLLSALLAGGIGAALGMLAFNHKTSKPRFRALVPASAVLACVVLSLLV